MEFWSNSSFFIEIITNSGGGGRILIDVKKVLLLDNFLVLKLLILSENYVRHPIK